MRIGEYLARIGLKRPLEPSLDTLRRLHVAHLGAFTFDNLEIQRNGTVLTDIDSVERKFLDQHAGGYCFEQNTLFGAALRELGFETTTLLGRVCAGLPERRARNHMILRVDIASEPWLADVGFGATGPLEPLPLREGVTERQAGIDYTIRREASHWVVSMRCGEETEDLYEFTDDPHTEGDVEMANYYTSTHPTSVFRRTLTIQRTTPEERLILRNTVLTRYRDGVRTDTPIEPAQVRALAKELFGLDLGETPLLFETVLQQGER